MKKKNLPYWDQDTETAIIEYNKSNDTVIREKLYNDVIFPALMKMSECIINTFKFNHFETDFPDVQCQAISHLTEQLPKFDHTSGFKSFSFFSVVCKHYLIQLSKKNYKHWQRTEPVEFTTELYDNERYNEPHRELVDGGYDYECDTNKLDFIMKLREFWYKVSITHGVLFDNCIINRSIKAMGFIKENKGSGVRKGKQHQRFGVKKLNEIVGISCNNHTIINSITDTSYKLYQYYLDHRDIPEPEVFDKKLLRFKIRNKHVRTAIQSNLELIRNSAKDDDTKAGMQAHQEGLTELILEIRDKIPEIKEIIEEEEIETVEQKKISSRSKAYQKVYQKLYRQLNKK